MSPLLIFDAIALHRVAYRLHKWRIPLIPAAIDGIIFLLFNSVVHHSTPIGRDTKLAYRGMSVLIHRRTVIGARVMIGPHVVIGGRSGHEQVPVIEDDVYIGPNSCILGPIVIRQGTIIGAGAVVLDSTEAGSVVAGVPARPIRKKTHIEG